MSASSSSRGIHRVRGAGIIRGLYTITLNCKEKVRYQTSQHINLLHLILAMVYYIPRDFFAGLRNMLAAPRGRVWNSSEGRDDIPECPPPPLLYMYGTLEVLPSTILIINVLLEFHYSILNFTTSTDSLSALSLLLGKCWHWGTRSTPSREEQSWNQT